MSGIRSYSVTATGHTDGRRPMLVIASSISPSNKLAMWTASGFRFAMKASRISSAASFRQRF
ncbi:hypothetical protein D3C78_1548950 [compost metagenome]